MVKKELKLMLKAEIVDAVHDICNDNALQETVVLEQLLLSWLQMCEQYKQLRKT